MAGVRSCTEQGPVLGGPGALALTDCQTCSAEAVFLRPPPHPDEQCASAQHQDPRRCMLSII